MVESLEIPFRLLSEEALKGLIEEFVSREGTDYGQGEYTLEEKAASVRRQLETGRAVIIYDPATEGCNIALKEDMKSI
ncbi:MAG: YheU family protein [Deltaproteobacteria bacterium]|nr:YheU family protein [Deltaproteobacteria bacterium]